jgi:hypothetical protein
MLLGARFTAQAAAQQHFTVAAGSGDAGKYCALYEQTLVNKLHVSPATLEQANIEAMTAVLDQLVTDGQITKTERDQLTPLLAKLGVSPCQNLNGKTVMSYLQSDPLIGTQVLAAHAALTGAVAQALNMQPDALAAALSGGKTVGALATQQKVDISKVNAAYLDAAKTFLGQAVTSGLITQPQADALTKALTSAVASGKYPLLTFSASSFSASSMLGQ